MKEYSAPETIVLRLEEEQFLCSSYTDAGSEDYVGSDPWSDLV